jgi:hypothetical protein
MGELIDRPIPEPDPDREPDYEGFPRIYESAEVDDPNEMELEEDE